MKPNRIVTLLFMMTFIVSAINADNRDHKKFSSDRTKQEAELCVEHLKLKGDSAAGFVKIYVEYKKKIHNVFESGKSEMGKEKKGQKPTREDVDRRIRTRFAEARAILDIREEYYNKFLTVLSPRQYEKFCNFEFKLGERMKKELDRRRELREKGRQAVKTSSKKQRKKAPVSEGTN